jgi:hypothetical protein
MTAKWTDFVSGAVLTAAQLNDVLDNFQDMAIFNETQASGTNSGTFTAGSFAKRTLNTTVVNNITGCSLASSVITLPAGSYRVSANSQGILCGVTQARLQNTTAGTTIAISINQFAEATVGQANCLIETYFTLTGSTNIELQSRCATTQATNGLGASCSFGNNEVYRSITITKVA